MLTHDEIKGLRMALRFGVPEPEPAEIASARCKLEGAQATIEAGLRRKAQGQGLCGCYDPDCDGSCERDPRD